MHLSQQQLSDEHIFTFDVPGGRRVYSYSGVLLTDARSEVNDWERAVIELGRPIPELPDGRGFAIEQWTPVAGLSAVAQGASNPDAAWALDSFTLGDEGPIIRSLHLVFHLAVHGTNALIMKINYQIQMIGRVVELPPGLFFS
jgi:hypothetical protein